MKINHILLFMLSVLGGLARIAATFPANGITIGSATITFP
mgnify:CR=1 FL=1